MKCINEIDAKYEDMKQFSSKRLRELRIIHDLTYAVLPWRVKSCKNDLLSILFMGVFQLNALREKGAERKCRVELKLADISKILNSEDYQYENWTVIETLGKNNVSLVLSQVCKSYFSDPIFPHELKSGMLLIEALWNSLKQLFFDLESIKLRYETSTVVSKDNSLGLKITYISRVNGARADIYFWRVLLLKHKAGPQHELIVERNFKCADEINTRITELESRLMSNPTMLEMIECIESL